MLHRRHSLLWLVFCALLLPLLTLSLFAQEFSADFYQAKNARSQSSPTKIYVSNDKMRIEGGDTGPMQGAMILDLANHKNLFLIPARKMYIESMPGMGPGKQDIWFRPTDPNNACPQYEAMVNKYNNGPASCHKIGPDVVNGRAAIKYAGSSKNGSGYAWIDPKLRFVLKWEDDKGNTVELRNIKEGHQDASLFEVPSGYQKFDMQQMQQRQPR
jgi:hypothetical protein